MTYLKLCPKCRGKVVPNNRKRVGAWYCPRCDWCYSQLEIEFYLDNTPGGVTVIGPKL